MLAYVGMITSNGNQDVANGGNILFTITNKVFGSFGAVILILIFTLACLTTVVGLITSVSEYFAELTNNKVTYNQWIFIYTFISFVLANFGLDSILQFSVPILVGIYPPAIMLIIMALLQEYLNFDRLTYQATIYITLLIAAIAVLKSVGIELEFIDNILSTLPFYNDGLEWILPSFVVLIGMTILSKARNTTAVN